MDQNATPPKCSALTRRGQPCRGRPMRGSDPPLCAVHAGVMAPPGPPSSEKSRCTHQTLEGKRCRAWAVRGTDPPTCARHAGLAPGYYLPPDERRCTHQTAKGERCRRWATVGSDPPVCAQHADEGPFAGLRLSNIVCSFETREGRPCGAYALPGSDPPACAAHACVGPPPRLPSGDEPRCTHQTLEGERCRSWALPGTDPAACAVHAGICVSPGGPPGNQKGRTHGFYTRSIDPEELADLVRYGEELTLDDEIACARVSLRRVMAAAATIEDPRERPEHYARLVDLALQATRTIARLLKTRQELVEAGPDPWQEAIDGALDMLGEEWGLPL